MKNILYIFIIACFVGGCGQRTQPQTNDAKASPVEFLHKPLDVALKELRAAFPENRKYTKDDVAAFFKTDQTKFELCDYFTGGFGEALRSAKGWWVVAYYTSGTSPNGLAELRLEEGEWVSGKDPQPSKQYPVYFYDNFYLHSATKEEPEKTENPKKTN